LTPLISSKLASQSFEFKWIRPTPAHGLRWSGFLISHPRDPSAKYRQAKCTYCNQVFVSGKPPRLFQHIKEVCLQIPSSTRHKYLLNLGTLSSEGESGSDTDLDQPKIDESSSDEFDQSSAAVGPPAKRLRPSNEAGSSSLALSFDSGRIEKLHTLLLSAMISSAVPFSFLENRYFQQYQHELAGPGFEIPRHGKMATETLSKVHASLEADTINRILDLDNITLSLDGWTDVAGNSIYALIVLKGPQSRFFIDVLYFHRQQHDPRNIISSVKQSLSERCVDIEKACAIVTSSSPLMIEFQVCGFR
jgi:hypothetical protein